MAQQGRGHGRHGPGAVRPVIPRTPIVVASGLVGLVLGAGHLLAPGPAAAMHRVPVVQRDPLRASGFSSVAEWPADRDRVFQEAPMFAGRSLPPVAERLPERPQIVVPVEQAGPYGGTWTRFPTTIGEAMRVDVEYYINASCLVRWAADGSRLDPDVAERMEVALDGRSVSFRLRPGLRWSDGSLFTSADVRFWWDHLANDLAVNPNPPMALLSASAALETPDPLSVRFVLARPDALVADRFAFEIWASDLANAPAHYLRRHHPSGGRSTAELNAAAKAAGYPGWAERFRALWSWRNPQCPRLWTWLMKTPPPATTVVLERNPYFRKVDPAGRQLPYIDRIVMSLTDAESVPLKLMRGDSPLQERYLRPKDYALLMADQERGGYRVRHWLGAPLVSVALNRGHRDPEMRRLFTDGRLARALSLATDRVELVRLFVPGVGRATQAVPHPASAFHAADLAGRDTMHDLASAEALLDEIGCVRSADGQRRLPDGRPLRLQFDVLRPDLIEPGQVIAQQWAKAGVAVDVRLYARELYYARKDNSEHDALLDDGGGGNETLPLLDARAYVPGQGDSAWAGLYGTWVKSKGARGLPPPPDLGATLDDWEAITASTDPGERRRRFAAILERAAGHRAVIGLYTLFPPFLVVRDDLRNAPQVAVNGWSFRGLAPSLPEAFALAGGRR